MMQIDYLFIVKCLSELCVYSDDFIQDFKIKGEDRRGQKTVKNGLFLTHGVLEVLHNLVFMNGTKTMKYGLNQYVPQVVQRGEKEMIIAGVNFKRNSVKLALNDDKLWDEFYSYISDGKTNFIPGTFGLKGAYEYFKKLNKDVVYLNS